jgi:carbamoyl-phosphate synthase large subunit
MMSFEEGNVLILSAGRRVELVQSFLTELEKRGLQSKLFGTDLNPILAPACHFTFQSFIAPSATDPEYINFLHGICVTHKIKLIIPTIDTELLLLARHHKSFESMGIYVVISDESLIQLCRDKRLTANFFHSLNIDTPKIYDRSNLIFPCFIKPFNGSRSIGAAPIKSADMLSDSMLSDENMMFMELIGSTYQEYTVDAYYDRHGKLCCMVPRERLETRAGEISKGSTRRGRIYEILKEKLSILEGAKGCITLQFFFNPNTEHLIGIEINPRFGGGFPLSYSSGANYPGWLIDEYMLNKGISFFEGWESNLTMLRYDAKVLLRDRH